MGKAWRVCASFFTSHCFFVNILDLSFLAVLAFASVLQTELMNTCYIDSEVSRDNMNIKSQVHRINVHLIYI